jgi:ABC-type glycerol-3-phosphate transport system permease component
MIRRRHRKFLDENMTSKIVSSRRERVTIYVLLIVLGLLFIFPIYSGFAISLQVNGFQNYVDLFTQPINSATIWQTYFNTFAVGCVQASVVLFVCSTAGYAFSKLQFRGREVGFSAMLLFLAVPAVAILVPVYRITEQLHLFNNYIGVGLPEAALTIPFGVLLIRNYGSNISTSLTEAASIDGAGHFRIFWSVFIPMSRPVLVNLGVLCFIWSLQDYLWPSFIMTNPHLATAAQAVQTFSNSLQGPTATAEYNASLMLLALPALLFVTFGLRYIISGISGGGNKE